MKTCSTCGVEKSLEDFPPDKREKDGKRRICRACRQAYNREYRRKNRETLNGNSKRWRKLNPEKSRDRAREEARQVRRNLVSLYGARCACCGEGTFEFLALDHVNGDGAKERREKSTARLYRELVSYGERRPEYRLLCHNCNQARGFYGYCPHELNSE